MLQLNKRDPKSELESNHMFLGRFPAKLIMRGLWKTFENGIHSIFAWRSVQKEWRGEKADAHIVLFRMALDGIPPPLCGSQVMGPAVYPMWWFSLTTECQQSVSSYAYLNDEGRFLSAFYTINTNALSFKVHCYLCSQ